MDSNTIKKYTSGKCIKFQTTMKGGWFSDDIIYDVKIFTTIPHKKVPIEETVLEDISKKVVEGKDNWNTASNDNEGYTHRTRLKEHKGLIILIKKSKKNE